MGPAAAILEAAFLLNMRQLGAYLFVTEAEQNAWYQAGVDAWPQVKTQANEADWARHFLRQTQSHWQPLRRQDATAAVDFIEASAQRLWPEGMRWSVAQPQEVLDVETLFIEANQQLRPSGLQFYQLIIDEGVFVPVAVADEAGFKALLQCLRLSYRCFAGSEPRHPEGRGGYGSKQILFWVLYVILVLWGVYHLAEWVLSWLWHWFD